MLLKELYQSMHGKIDTRIGRAFAPITEVDDEQMIKYKSDDGESKEMKSSSAKSMPKDHPAKIEYDKLAGGDDGEKKKGVNIFDEPPAEPDDEDDGGLEGSDDDWDRDPDLDPWDDGGDYARPGDDDWEDDDETGPGQGINWEHPDDDEDENPFNHPDYDNDADDDEDDDETGPGQGINWKHPDDDEDDDETGPGQGINWKHPDDDEDEPEESIIPKGSFRKIKEQWLNSIL
jgi:hypothetical protein